VFLADLADYADNIGQGKFRENGSRRVQYNVFLADLADYADNIGQERSRRFAWDIGIEKIKSLPRMMIASLIFLI
jgi:hypothetical protein